ncbi:MAG: ATP-dependent DNA helicase, partial [Bacteroidota bacterium]|nr:ATP-dependent DNA helicase [Bacteroidota bacterium]
MLSPHDILKQYWGHTSFRHLQEEIILAVMQGKDVLALLPTGGGKSICFQVPALAIDGLCLVISPLIALMKDQVENLKKRNIMALSIYSGMTYFEVKQTLQNAAFGTYKFLYVSPERLETKLFKEYLPAFNLNLIAVDEAHCISQWGYDFRPPYLRIASIRQAFPAIPVLALTASATPLVQLDICQNLLFNEQNIFRQSFEKPNLSFSVFKADSKFNKLLEVLEKVPGTAIVYCRNRKGTKEIANLLRLNNVAADFYHAGLAQEQRNQKQEDWINNKIRVIVCTNAFGMGIDKPDVRAVVHIDLPDNLENYYQEAGRAGRDGRRAYAVLLYTRLELDELKRLPEIKYPSVAEIRNVYQALANHLQIPVGSGEGMYYDFNLNEFVLNFKLDVFLAINAIKALEQEGILSFNEQVFLPSKISFTCDKDALHAFEISHPHLENLIKYLLRSYEGIFDNEVSI